MSAKKRTTSPAPTTPTAAPPAAAPATNAASDAANAASDAAPDMSLALAAPLTAKEMHPLLKIGDSDRAIAARVAKAFAKHEAELNIKGVSSAGMLAAIRTSEALVISEAQAQAQVDRLMGARLVADNKIWKGITKLHRRIQNEGGDFPAAATALGFLVTYFTKRGRKVEPPPPKPTAAEVAAKKEAKKAAKKAAAAAKKAK